MPFYLDIATSMVTYLSSFYRFRLYFYFRIALELNDYSICVSLCVVPQQPLAWHHKSSTNQKLLGRPCVNLPAPKERWHKWPYWSSYKINVEIGLSSKCVQWRFSILLVLLNLMSVFQNVSEFRFCSNQRPTYLNPVRLKTSATSLMWLSYEISSFSASGFGLKYHENIFFMVFQHF